MKQTMNALALAAGIVATIPAWAQSPMAPPAPSASGPIVHPQMAPGTATGTYSQTAPTTPSAMAPAGDSADTAMDEAKSKRRAARVHHVRHEASARTSRTRHGAASADHMADQLNRQEAARISSGAPSEPAAGTTMQGSSQGAAPASK